MTQDEIAKLSAAERLSLIGELWDSLADSETPLPEEQRAELIHRLARFEKDRPDAVSWDALKSEMDARKR